MEDAPFYSPQSPVTDLTAPWFHLSAGEWRSRDGIGSVDIDVICKMPDNEQRDAQPEDMDVLTAELASADLTPEGVSAFIARWGFLGVLQGVAPTDECVDLSFAGAMCEPLTAWREAVTILRIAWRAYAGSESDSEDEGELRIERYYPDAYHKNRPPLDVAMYAVQVICDLDEESVVPRSDWLPKIDYMARSEFPSYRPAESADPADMQRFPTWIFEASPNLGSCDQRMAAIAAIVSHFTRRLVGSEVVIRNNGRRDITFSPMTLLGDAWMRFAFDLTGSAPPEILRCPECRHWYRKKREDQRTCGRSLCRQAVYARNCERARQLADSGMDYHVIAARMSTENATTVTAQQVEKWVTASRKRRKHPKGA